MAEKLTVKEALKKWEEYRRNVERETPVPTETDEEKLKRVSRLLKDPFEFAKFYFPNYCSAEFAGFQKRAVRKVVKEDVIYAVMAWSREHAKSVIFGLFAPMYLKFTGRLKNMLLISYSNDNATELLMPIMINLESNQRIISDFGPQKSWRGWEAGRFVTKDNCSFRAIGARQSPRGTRNEEARPDYVLFDDFDTDEESRNQERINKKFEWAERAVWPAMSISGTKRFIWAGNIISKKSCVVQAAEKADFKQKVNILDKNGKPSWAERYTKADIDYMLSKISYNSGQAEYFNNPITEGTVFKSLTWGRVPPLSRFRFLVAYGDPSYKDSKKSDFKSVPLLGVHNNTLYIIKARIAQTGINEMIDWYYFYRDEVGSKATLYNYIEAGSLQDTFFKEIFRPRMDAKAKTQGHILIIPDHRKKTDKFTRIEASLEPLNRAGRLVFNEREKNDPHMQVLRDQFLAVEPKLSAHDDGPDSVEGGWFIINSKLRELAPIKVGKGRRDKNKF